MSARRGGSSAPTSDAILVTGGTGFLGEHLLDLLTAEGGAKGVRVLARRASSRLRDRGVDVIAGAITDPDAVRRAVEGCRAIYHLAGVVSRDPDDAPQMMRTHVEGTRVLVEAALAAKVERIVLASTSGTVGVSTDRDHLAAEEDPYPLEILRRWPYYLSKVYQEELALRYHRERGLDVVCVNPSILFGPGDRRLSSTRDVLRFLEGKVPFVPSGGISFVDARDVAAALPAALAKGKAGERYLMGAVNWPMKEFFHRLARIARLDPPLVRVPDRVSLFGARLVETFYRWRGAEAPLDLQSVEMSQHFWYIDSSKAERELGFQSRDPNETLRDTVRYLRRHQLHTDDGTDDDAILSGGA